MTLRIGAPRLVTEPVETIDGQTFTATFKILPDDELNELAGDSGKAALRAVIVELHDIVGANDEPLPYTDELRESILAYGDYAIRLQRAYQRATVEAALGN